MMVDTYRDRDDADRQLAWSLDHYRAERPLVLAIPRGAVRFGSGQEHARPPGQRRHRGESHQEDRAVVEKDALARFAVEHVSEHVDREVETEGDADQGDYEEKDCHCGLDNVIRRTVSIGRRLSGRRSTRGRAVVALNSDGPVRVFGGSADPFARWKSSADLTNRDPVPGVRAGLILRE